MKCIGSVLLVGVEGPCFTAIKQTWFTFILVLMVSIVLFQTLCQSSHCCCCCCCFADPLVQLDVQKRVARDGGTEVGELFHYLKLKSPMVMFGMLLPSWPLMLVFLRLIVRLKSLHHVQSS